MGSPLSIAGLRASSSRRGTARYISLVALLCAVTLTMRSVGLGAAAISGAGSSTLVAPEPPAPVRPIVAANIAGDAHVAPATRVEVPPPVPDTDLRLAYFVQISANTMGHLPRLLARIWERGNVYAIHIDEKVPKAQISGLRGMLERQNPEYAKNVHWMEPELITYRGVSMLLNTINGMQMLLDKQANWDYFINLSGSDYPMIAPARQREILASVGRNHNFFSMAPSSSWQSNTMYRFKNFYVDEALSFRTGPTHVVMVARVNPLSKATGFVYANSEAWMVNSREFVDYVVSSPAARKLLVTFAYSVESSEHYFSTLIYNSRFNRTLVPSALRQVIWEHKGRDAGQHPFYVDDVDSSGKFTFHQRVLQGVQFFTRKFKKPNSPLMDEIDAQLEEPTHVNRVKEHFKWVMGKGLLNARARQGRLPFD